MRDPLKQFIGTLYFSPNTNDDGKPVSKYEGVVVGFIVKRDSGEEFTVRDETALPYRSRALKREDLENLKLGDQVMRLSDNRVGTVMRVFPVYGDVWVKDNETGHTTPLKFTDLKKVTSAV